MYPELGGGSKSTFSTRILYFKQAGHDTNARKIDSPVYCQTTWGPVSVFRRLQKSIKGPFPASGDRMKPLFQHILGYFIALLSQLVLLILNFVFVRFWGGFHNNSKVRNMNETQQHILGTTEGRIIILLLFLRICLFSTYFLSRKQLHRSPELTSSVA